MLTIYGRANSSNVRKVLWFAGEIGLSYERLDYGRGYAATDTPDYLALNPNGLVPTLVDGETVIWESNAILRYLAAKHDEASWLPQDLGARAEVEQWMDWQLSVVGPGMAPLFLGGHLGLPPFNDPERVAAGLAATTGAMKILSERVGKTGAFIAGDDITVADCAVGMYVHRWFALDIERPAMPALEAYYARLSERGPFREFIIDIGV